PCNEDYDCCGAYNGANEYHGPINHDVYCYLNAAGVGTCANVGSPPPVTCGDGSCDPGETCTGCPPDCGACPTVCGDATCSPGENCLNCPDDCGSCPPCGDGTCASGEDCGACPADCGCAPGETCMGGVCAGCGNGACDSDETCGNCP